MGEKGYGCVLEGSGDAAKRQGTNCGLEWAADGTQGGPEAKAEVSGAVLDLIRWSWWDNIQEAGCGIVGANIYRQIALLFRVEWVAQSFEVSFVWVALYTVGSELHIICLSVSFSFIVLLFRTR